MTADHFKNAPHPLDPLRPEEVKRASQILIKHLDGAVQDIRFKVIDLVEPPKDLVIKYLDNSDAIPDRKARVYYHVHQSSTLVIAILNITSSLVENVRDEPDAQGPVDWTEFELVHKACVENPRVQAEVAKLKLPS